MNKYFFTIISLSFFSIAFFAQPLTTPDGVPLGSDEINSVYSDGPLGDFGNFAPPLTNESDFFSGIIIDSASNTGGTSNTNYLDGYSCYWMGYRNGKWTWLPAPSYMFRSGSGFERCKQLDSCDGGDGMSGGGCYKWALSPTSKRVPWNILSVGGMTDEVKHLVFQLTTRYKSHINNLSNQYREQLIRVLGETQGKQYYQKNK